MADNEGNTAAKMEPSMKFPKAKVPGLETMKTPSDESEISDDSEAAG